MHRMRRREHDGIDAWMPEHILEALVQLEVVLLRKRFEIVRMRASGTGDEPNVLA